MHGLARDLKFAVRSLAKSPGFSIVVVLTLALGVGANTAIFSIVHAVILRPLPFEAPQRIVTVWEHSPDDSGVLRKFRVTAGNFNDWRTQATVFEDMAIFGAAGFNWTGAGEPEQLLGARVSASYFSVLGVSPILGRAFAPEENEPGRDLVLLLGHGLWQRRFGGAPDVVGRVLTLDGEPYEVVGVMPEGVYPTWPQATGRIPFLPLYQQLWVPMALSEERMLDRRSHVFGVIARLNADASIETARAEMATIASRIDPEESALVVPYLDEILGGAKGALLVLLGAVGLVLLVACANIASLVLARSAGRSREIALRTALGAGRGALLRQFLTESIVLSVVGGALGTGLALFGVELLVRLSPAEIPRLAESGLSLPVLGFALAVSIATGIFFGLAPATQVSRADLRRRMAERVPHRSKRYLVVAEVSLAVVLVVGASLLVQSFFKLQEVDLGFSAPNVLLAELTLPPSEYSDWRAISSLHRELLDRLDALPQVRSSALAYDHPLESNWIDGFRLLEGPLQEEPFAAAFRIVSPEYFRTLGIDLVAGRAFEPLDDAQHPGAVIVNEAFVRRYFEGGDALEKRISTTTPSRVWGEPIPRVFEVVGIVENVRFLGPAEGPEPAFYVPAAQFPVAEMLVALRVDGDPASLSMPLRSEIWAIDPSLPVSNVTTMERLLEEALAQPRFNAFVLGVFGVTGLALAALGIYGLLSRTVVERTTEIGLRMALGARATDVTCMVVGQGLSLTAIGLAVGIPSAFLASRVLRSLLFGVSASDPATFASVAIFLGGVAVVASYLPARRASRIDPLVALRSE